MKFSVSLTVDLVFCPLLSRFIMKPGAQCLWLQEKTKSQRKDCLRENLFERLSLPALAFTVHSSSTLPSFNQDYSVKLQVGDVLFFYHWLQTTNVFREIGSCHFRHTTLSLKALGAEFHLMSHCHWEHKQSLPACQIFCLVSNQTRTMKGVRLVKLHGCGSLWQC